MAERKNYGKVLKKENLRSTSHRNSVLEIMEAHAGPMSAEDLYLALKDKKISISLSTVYRILEVLVEKEIAVKSDITHNHKSLYEINRMNHRHYLVCVGCSKIMSVEDCPFHEYAKILEERYDFNITGHRLEMFGYCVKCRSGKR